MMVWRLTEVELEVEGAGSGDNGGGDGWIMVVLGMVFGQ